MFFDYVLKVVLISDIEYDPSGRSSLLFDVGADVLNSLFFYAQQILRFTNATLFSPLPKSIFKVK